jgi:hypothetical protein
MSAPRLPDPNNIRSFEELRAWAIELHRAVQIALSDLHAQAATGYVVMNHTPTRSLDASAATLADVRNVLGTVIDDLKTGKQGTILG